MLLSRSNLYLSNTGCVFREVSSLCRYFVSLTFKVCLEKFKSVFAYVRRVGDNRLTELHHDRYMYAYTLRSALSVFPLARLPPHLLYSLTSVHLATGSSPVREGSSVWTGQREYCPSLPSDAHKHLSHTGRFTLGSRSVSSIHW